MRTLTVLFSLIVLSACVSTTDYKASIARGVELEKRVAKLSEDRSILIGYGGMVQRERDSLASQNATLISERDAQKARADRAVQLGFAMAKALGVEFAPSEFYRDVMPDVTKVARDMMAARGMRIGSEPKWTVWFMPITTLKAIAPSEHSTTVGFAAGNVDFGIGTTPGLIYVPLIPEKGMCGTLTSHTSTTWLSVAVHEIIHAYGGEHGSDMDAIDREIDVWCSSNR